MSPATGRTLAEDTRTGAIGEIMPDTFPARLRHPDAPYNVWLRPVGGGREWEAPQEAVRPVQP